MNKAVITALYGILVCVGLCLLFEEQNMMTENNKHNSQNMRDEILRRRYLWKDNQGNVVETEDQMYRRVAKHITEAETKYGATETEVKG